jgi:hypothetical protein
VDYCNPPIRCRYCLATNHLVRDCTALQGNHTEASGEGQGAGRQAPSGQTTAKAAPVGLATGNTAPTGQATMNTALDIVGGQEEGGAAGVRNTAQESTLEGDQNMNEADTPEDNVNIEEEVARVDQPQRQEIPTSEGEESVLPSSSSDPEVFPPVPRCTQDCVHHVLHSSSSTSSQGRAGSSSSGNGYPMPNGYTDSCFTDVPCRDGFQRVTRTDIGKGFERVRERRWNRPHWIATSANGDAQVDEMTARKAECWGNHTKAEYRQENRVFREAYWGRGRGGARRGTGPPRQGVSEGNQS